MKNDEFKIRSISARCAIAFLGFMLNTVSFGMESSATMPEKYQKEVLFLHNKLRAQHHAPSLTWDDELAAYAARYASKCRFQHSGSPYGENLAAGYPSVSAAVNTWYAEGKNYSYHWPGFSRDTGHFTQLVWKASKKLGCGYATCDGRNGTPGNYLVCEYSPPGNVLNRGYFSKNVLGRAGT